jgi:peptide/nickel transport system substrate-binding protein
VILLSQLREVYIDAELETVDTAQWYPKVMRKDWFGQRFIRDIRSVCCRTGSSSPCVTVGLSVTEAGVNDPDQQFYENYRCGAERNYTGYCNPEVDKLVDQQSMEPNREKRERLVWDIERRLAEEWRPAGHLLPSRRDVPAALGERADDHGEYHLQWLALRRRLARQVEVLRPCHRLC